MKPSDSSVPSLKIAVNRDETRKALYRKHLANGQTLRFKPLGVSMWPWIRQGDVVHVEPIDRLAIGDVVLCEREGHWFLHRLVQFQKTSLGERIIILRGDSLPHKDPPFKYEQFLGRATIVERGKRQIHLDHFLRKYATNIFTRLPIFNFNFASRLCRLPNKLRHKLISLTAFGREK